jgi:predicted ATP-grasp superfamily ATP-dependent carboligase
MTATSNASTPPAVVVGLCAHGLAVARALDACGVRVHALEQDPSLPGCRSRAAHVSFARDINGEGLIPALIDRARELGSAEPPVLFLTNDNMVRTIADRWPELAPYYRLSWSGRRAEVRMLLEKSELEARCATTGSAYPHSMLVDAATDLGEVRARLELPVIAKPVRPLSSFKVRVLATLDELARLRAEHAAALPFLVQSYVPGGDERIRFCALYLDRGREIARFDGRKLRSRPMGHTTIAEPSSSEPVHAETHRFLAGLELTGPVSVEWKLDPTDRPWIIEPTVGRTDFWIDVCIANGVNLPWIEYCHQAGLPLPQARQRYDRTWINTERDPAALTWWAGQVARRRANAGRPRFPYLSAADPCPIPQATLRAAQRLLRRLGAMPRATGRSS